MYSKITNPETGRIISIRSKLGKKILRNYVRALSNTHIGGAAVIVLQPASQFVVLSPAAQKTHDLLVATATLRDQYKARDALLNAHRHGIRGLKPFGGPSGNKNQQNAAFSAYEAELHAIINAPPSPPPRRFGAPSPVYTPKLRPASQFVVLSPAAKKTHDILVANADKYDSVKAYAALAKAYSDGLVGAWGQPVRGVSKRRDAAFLAYETELRAIINPSATNTPPAPPVPPPAPVINNNVPSFSFAGWKIKKI